MKLKVFQSSGAKCVYILLAAFMLLCLMLFVSITPQRYNLRVGEISYSTITASKDVVDEISTARMREEAANAVEPTYVFREDVASQVMQDLNNVLMQASAVQQYGNKILAAESGSYNFSESEMKYARSFLTQITLADYQLNTLLRAGSQEMIDLKENMTTAVRNALNTAIREGYVNETIQYVQQMVAYKTELNLLQNVASPILRKVIQPNMVIDQEATEKMRDEARSAVEPVIYKQGQNIVLSRERVTANQLEMLRSLGLLDDDNMDMMMYIGGFLMVVFSILVLCGMLQLVDPETLKSPRRLLLVMISICVTMGLCVAGRKIHLYMMPVLLCAMMLTVLLNEGSAMASVISTAMLMSVLVVGSDTMYGSLVPNQLLISCVGGLTSILLLRGRPLRQRVLLTGLVTAAVNGIIILAVGFMTDTSLRDVSVNALWSAGSAAAAAILCIAFDPILEILFRLASPSRLMELSNPNHPLLRRLLIEASGTYHHSIIVANLAEAAAEAIGANPLLARVGAYFHDIGKLKRPMYFKENQMGDNPHDRTDPYVSAAILTAHPRDGLQLAQQYRLPGEIQDIIAQHHGDTPVMFFYKKALDAANGENVNISDFRYSGPRPASREAAIIMLADTVEAAVRSMADPTPDAIREFIHKLVWGKLDDGQMDDAPVSMSDISGICEAFSTVLNGVFHERIEYPSVSPSIASRVSASELSVPRTASPVEEKELRPADEKPAEEAEHEN